MFDFAWTEIALIGVVALIAIGPKDMPGAIKAVADMVKKARRMAGEFQTHVDEMVREANLDEVRSQISQIRNLDIKGTIERAVDGDGSIRKTFSEDPLKTNYGSQSTSPVVEAAPVVPVTSEIIAGDPLPEPASSYVPPGDLGGIGGRTLDRPTWLDSSSTSSSATPSSPIAPAFIPPAIASPPVPPAFIPPGTRPGGSRPHA
jgi:sec-independent protein translocase protein TatB